MEVTYQKSEVSGILDSNSRNRNFTAPVISQDRLAMEYSEFLQKDMYALDFSDEHYYSPFISTPPPSLLPNNKSAFDHYFVTC